MSEPEWLLADAVIAVHRQLIAEHGGRPGIRDRGLLESALSRPPNRMAHDPGADLFDLAAAYAWGLGRNHPFVDGNKRVALTAAAMFLRLNGYRFRPDRMEALRMSLRLAAGDAEESALSRWIEANAEPVSRPPT